MQRRGTTFTSTGYAVQDRSSVGRALACRPVSSLLVGTAPAFSLSGTGSPGGGCSPAAAAGTTAPPCPGWDCGGACPESASSPSLCAGLDGCGADGTGKPMTLVSRSSAPSRSKYTTGFCYISGWPADAIFFCVLHQGLPILHVLCYTLAHEGYGLLSCSWCVVTQL